MVTIMIIAGILIVLAVLLLSVTTVNKGYGYKHTIDPIDNKDDSHGNDSFADKAETLEGQNEDQPK
ncbi:Tumour necrosis factor receptor superfamily member 19 [Bacillus sp. OV322]|nr:YtzI protein [Bacillus sp. OV322]SFC59272.1 Tumour necrosis factor receptor superfamily member 19 [Bacillus sp. OV322]